MLTLMAGVAIHQAVTATTGLAVDIRWPNDLLVNGKKVCGILIENEVRRNTLVYAIIGIGINVNMHLADFPDIFPTATSLSDELGKEVSRLELVRQLLVEIDRLYPELPAGDTIYQQWRDNLVTLGRTVRVQSGEAVTEGAAESVGRDGSLFVRQQDGSLTRIVAGDATLLRK